VLAKQHFLLGNKFSVADAYLFTVMRWAIALQFDIKKRTQLSAYFDRVAARPAVDATLNAEGLK
jgi:glutathione S-transferase